MRKVLLLAAMLIAPAIAPAEAGERGSRHFAPHAGAKLHVPFHGKSFHGKSFHGKSFHGKSFHGKSFHGKSFHGKSFHGSQFAPHRHVRPRRFGGSGGGFVLKFHSGGFGFGAVRRFQHPHFRPPHPHFRPPHVHGPVVRFGHHPHVQPWRFAPRHPWSRHGRPHRRH